MQLNLNPLPRTPPPPRTAGALLFMVLPIQGSTRHLLQLVREFMPSPSPKALQPQNPQAQNPQTL